MFIVSFGSGLIIIDGVGEVVIFEIGVLGKVMLGVGILWLFLIEGMCSFGRMM